MTLVDAVIVVGSLVAVVALGGWLAVRQRVAGDYYLAGRRLPAWALGLSLAANQVSAISLVGAPAFVALRAGGGLRWLQYELAVPLAMAVLVIWGVPFIRQAQGADVYAAVEARLGAPARRVAAGLFLVGRGAGVGVVLYASALVVVAVTGWSLVTSLAVVGGVAVAYTALGGLAADVISDVAQFVILWGGTVVAGGFLAVRLLADGALFEGLSRDRLLPLDFVHHGLGDGATFAFWPMLVGGLFLYLAYYGCDQTQAQRILAARSPDEARTALAVASFARFPLVCTYCLFGVLLGELVAAEPAFAARLAGKPPDALVPEFLASAVPVGIRGVAVAGILAAALSSIDSALNSLSAVSLEELAPARFGAGLSVARLTTVAWGVLAFVAAWLFSHAGKTTIELVNQVGSALYGPTLAIFALAWLSRRANGRSAAIGGLAGVAANLLVGWLAPAVSWLWWNPFGFIVATAVGVAFGRSGQRTALPAVDARAKRTAGSLLVLFLVILGVLAAIWLAL
ncbi:MAG: sodium:solute symporter family transporter [Acidobacteriota bacterium]